MKSKCKKIIIFSGIFFFLFTKASLVFAREIQNYPAILNFTIPQNADLTDFVKYFFNLGVALACFLAVIVIALGALYYVIDYGRGKFKEEGKAWIKAGLSGLLIVICAYLIAYTINPDLTILKLEKLFSINTSGPPTGNNPTNIGGGYYQEIPIGSLTETLLTRTISCYEFDPEGNPVDYSTVDSSTNPITDDNNQTYSSPQYFIPTHLDHDRADCLLQLIDGAQKKGQVIAELSNQIVKMMNTCSCSNPDGTSKCTPVCGGAANCNDGNVSACPGGNCNSSSCSANHNPPLGCKPGPPDCCPAGVKNKIEKGPVQVGCGANNLANNNPKNIFADNVFADIGGANLLKNNFLLAQFAPPKKGDPCPCNVNGANLMIGTLNANLKCVCPKAGDPCTDGLTGKAGVFDKNMDCIVNGAGGGGGAACCDVPLKTYHGLDEFRCDPNPVQSDYQSCSGIADYVEKEITVNKIKIKLIDQKKWAQLNLLQQLTYFQEKIDDLKQQIQNDKSNLDSGLGKLAQCSATDMEKSSVDMIHIQEQAKAADKIISIQKSFSDPVTNQPIDSSKYCDGFNYTNSSCYKQCQNMCPDTSPAAVSCFSKCDQCKPSDSNYSDCLTKQETCIEGCWASTGSDGSSADSRPCIYAGGNDPPKNFNDCISSCQGGQGDCSKDCPKKFLPCTSEFTICQSQCASDSQCVLNNKSKCLINSQFFQQCGSLYSGLNCTGQNTTDDCGNLGSCISSSYLCQYGSNENAGYPDCLKSYSDCLINFKNYGLQSKSDCLSYFSTNKQYSADFIYKNPTTQQCPKPFDKLYMDQNGKCVDTSNCTNPSDPSTCPPCPTGTCLDFYPNTAKCPATSQCPDCPCNQINQTFSFSIPNQVASDPNTGHYLNNGDAGWSNAQAKIEANQIVGPQCNKNAYGGDPLTFYCRTAWEPQAPISGQWDKCQPQNEIPVGQTVDGAEKWANDIIKTAQDSENHIQQMVNLLTKIGRAIDSNDGYNYPNTIVKDYCKCNAKYESGNPICTTDCKFWEQWTPPQVDADGNQIPGFWTCGCTFIDCHGSPCQQIVDYLSQVWNNYAQLKTDYVNFYTTMLQEPRSDVMKMLTYSRKKMDECSQQSTGLSGGAVATFSCTKAYTHTTCLASRCYGILDGKTKGINETDNWFCATALLK